MAFNVGTIEASSVIDQSGFNAGIGSMHTAGNRFVADFRSKLQGVSESLGRVGRRMTAMVTLPIVAGLGSAVREAGRLEGALDKFNVVFAGMNREMHDFVDSFRGEFPIARREIVAASAALQDLMVPMGINRREAMGMTQEWMRLAGALSAFNDVPMEEVLVAIQSGIAGMSQPLRRFGIDVRQATLEQIALSEGLMKAGDEMTSQIRTQALLIAATKQSQDAINGLEEQKGSLLWVMQDFKAEVKDIAAEIGQDLLPMAKEWISTARDWLRVVRNLTPEQKQLGVVILGVTAAIGPLLLGLKALVGVMAILLSPLVAKIAALTALGAGFYYVYRNMGAFADRMPQVADVVRNAADGIKFLIDDMRALGRRIRATVDAINDLLYTYDDWKRDNADLVDSQPKESDAREFVSFSEVMKDAASGVIDGVKWMAREFAEFIGMMPDVNAAGKEHVETNEKITTSYHRMAEAISRARIEAAAFSGATRHISIYDEAVQKASSQTEKLMVDVGRSAGAMSRAVQHAAQEVARSAVSMGETLQMVISTSVADFAETLGNAFTGDAGASGFFNTILMVVADFGKQLGRMLIAAGVAALAFQRLLINPIGAIAAGTALIVAATAARNLLAAGPGQSVNDALISNGRVVHLHPNDDVLAMKNFGNLGGGAKTAIIHLKSVNELDSRVIWEANRRYEVLI
jgi:hypothetical protein